jgi:hypothetical protein
MVGTWEVYIIPSVMSILALNTAAIQSRIIILAIFVLALAIVDCQSSITHKMHQVLRLASTILLDQTNHGE